ncbi:MAG: ABC transporter substrate-binding protein [Caldilineaceae bacterium]|nr:ABC transporter substrate-binding protein [Caldilineaceae bacterium]
MRKRAHKRISRREFMRVSAFTAAGVVVVACGADGGPPSEEAAAADEAPAEEAAAEPAAAPSKYNEAPMLAEMVANGELPPVDERLPVEPLVITPEEEIGDYGGIWNRLATSASDNQLGGKVGGEHLVRYNKDGTQINPNVFESWEVSDDGSTFTFNLRPGMKWSDGEPYTANDLLFYYEDVLLNEDLTPSFPNWLIVAGEPVVISKLDDYKVEFKFAAPYALFINVLGSLWGDRFARYCAHYLKQFHVDYADKDELEAMMKDAGVEHWYQLFGTKPDTRRNPDTPSYLPWNLSTPSHSDPLVADRNAFYWKVDPEGNQLPYIDAIHWSLVDGKDQLNLRAIQGEVDMQLRHITFDNVPLFMENRERGNYRVMLWDRGQVTDTVLHLNHTNKDPVLREIVQDKRFRYALSLGMNRADINEAVYLGQTEPTQVSPTKNSPVYWEPQAISMTEHDPDQANAYLDEMGLTERDDEGYRLRPDGERLSLVFEYVAIFAAWGDIAELLTSQWKEIGLELISTEIDRSLFGQRLSANELDLGVWHSSGEWNPFIEPRSFVPIVNNYALRQYAFYYNSGGKEGFEPTGDILKAIEIWEEIKTTVDVETQHALFREILELNMENLWQIGVTTAPPQPVIVKNYFRNVPEDGMFDDQPRSPSNTGMEQYFIRAGEDT